jgi:hypothetical protein
MKTKKLKINIFQIALILLITVSGLLIIRFIS